MDFPLPDDDTEYLNAHFPGWTQMTEGSKRGLIIPNYPLPDGYTPDKSDLMLIIPTDYPAGKIDMFYFDPHVARKNGKDIGALNDESHFWRNWQRWSRHYDWTPGVDSIVSHISFVHEQLKSELRK